LQLTSDEVGNLLSYLEQLADPSEVRRVEMLHVDVQKLLERLWTAVPTDDTGLRSREIVQDVITAVLERVRDAGGALRTAKMRGDVQGLVNRISAGTGVRPAPHAPRSVAEEAQMLRERRPCAGKHVLSLTGRCAICGVKP
jgi:hypothetical protein